MDKMEKMEKDEKNVRSFASRIPALLEEENQSFNAGFPTGGLWWVMKAFERGPHKSYCQSSQFTIVVIQITKCQDFHVVINILRCVKH